MVVLCVTTLLAFMLCLVVSCAKAVLLKITAANAITDKVDLIMISIFRKNTYLYSYGFIKTIKPPNLRRLYLVGKNELIGFQQL